MTVDAAFPSALWQFYASTGIRPEYIVPVLASESGLNPAATNSINCRGISQICAPYPLPADYTSWSASQQLLGPVLQMMRANVQKFGPLNSGVRLYQSNFLPVTLPTATSLSSVIAQRSPDPHGWYAANAGLDYTHKGTITLSDLAHFVGLQASKPYVQNILAQAYAVAPSGVGSMQDPVYGTDFSSGPSQKDILIVFGILLVGAGIAYGVHKDMIRLPRLPRPSRLFT